MNGGVNVLTVIRRYARNDKFGWAWRFFENHDKDGMQGLHGLVLKITGSGITRPHTKDYDFC